MTPTAKIMIAAGGTGGHIFPGLAIADALQASGAAVVWLGAGGMETRLVQQRGLPLFSVPFKSPRHVWQLPLLLVAVWRAWRLLARVRPAALLCMGGYAAVPGGLAAWLRRVPVVVHEQNAVTGKANRLLAKVAKAVLTGFPAQEKNQQYVGNPVRIEFTQVSKRPRPREVRRVLVLGGSQGAQALNQLLPPALALLQVQNKAMQVVHQCGKENAATVAAAYQQQQVPATVHEFIDDVATAMQDADIVVCRAGAATLAELATAGVGAVLVPYPYAAADHQSANARRFSESGAAVLCPQQQLNAHTLALVLLAVNCQQLALAATELAMPEAATTIANHCLKEAGCAA
ncbi:MAG: undecaprenyldiphospho-muramoylpentapeptide beta-N-acetylglucosaminyltransferase [Proteobacteria bacterium]|nr:undecaprenyldiphospho-muramoylpentapeptide beta-N-acetylglucosaminyltransferase [Pseudomonadota bacterium]